MDLITTLTIIGTLFAAATFIVTLAQLNEEAWARLKGWFKNTFPYLQFLFALGALTNGALGTLIFAYGSGNPSRKDILHLLLFMVNIGIGFWQLDVWVNARVQAKKQRKAQSAITPES